MREANQISHDAIVTDCSNGQARLSLMSVEDCHHCHLKSLCKLEDDPTLSVASRDLHVGDMVKIYLRPSQAFAASFLAYLLPSLLIIGILVIGTGYGLSDVKLGSIALLSLIPYYTLIALTRKRVKNLIDLQVKKL
ncbi:MAG: SoxR reducing system RseC family protein [Bacteroidota bacterium]